MRHVDTVIIRSLFRKRKLVPAVLQDARSGDILMLAYVNARALRLTLETGLAHFYSRSRRRLWKKGETSGNVQRVVEIRYDCDEDALLFKARPTGPACHTGRVSCFYRTMRLAGPKRRLAAVREAPSGRRGGRRGRKPRR